MENKSVFFVLFVALVFTACATATGNIFQPLKNISPETQSILYVYRPADTNFDGFNAAPNLYVGAKEVGILKRSGYLAIPVNHGKSVISLQGTGLNYGFPPLFSAIKAEPGKDIYLRLDIRYKAISSDQTISFNEVSKEQALLELKDLKSSL